MAICFPFEACGSHLRIATCESPMMLAFIGSPWQMLLLALVVLLLFGSRLPSTMRSLGKSVNEFKKGIREGEESAEEDEEAARH
jgi:sec-independent protein translocase protein TatA